MLPILKNEVNRFDFLNQRFWCKHKMTIDSMMQLSDSIGHKTWVYLSEIEDDLDEITKKIFYEGVRGFYKLQFQQCY